MEEDRRHQDSEARRQDVEMRRQQVDGRRHQQLLAQVSGSSNDNCASTNLGRNLNDRFSKFDQL